MGQGYSLSTLSAGSAGIDVPELSHFSYEKSLGEARFMKTIRARHRHGLVVIKVAMKPYTDTKLGKYVTAILNERRILKDIPNALAWYNAFETASNGYLVRQYVYSSLYDRMSTRPFLEDVEKRWLAFQLLSVVRDCHANHLHHGDIKSENILVTSWNWLYLTDFSSSFKPAYLPEDNPAEFSFYFDIAGRRTCYLAPERFLGIGDTQDTSGPLNWAMDIFSVGCVIAELFLEAPIFTLTQLFNYKRGNYDPVSAQLQRIDDPEIRELVSHMIQLEPESRYSADEYLNFWRGKAFPDYFSSFLHQYMALITDPSSGRAAITGDATNLGESDDRIARVYSDYDKIAYFLEYTHSDLPNLIEIPQIPGTGFPVHIDLPRRRLVKTQPRSPGDEGTFLFLSIVTSSLRSTARSVARLQAADLLLAFSEHISDEAKMDRVLPFIMTLLDDNSEMVQVAALRSVAQLTSIVVSTSPVNAFVFPEYILPKLADMFQPRRNRARKGVLVRLALAQCIAPLAEAAAKFLDCIEALKSEGSLPSASSDVEENESFNAYQDYYDQTRLDLIRFFESQAKRLLTDDAASIRRTFLGSIGSLCVFFGSAKTSDVILSHLNTYLNDRDWRLKSSFFDAIVGVAVYVGSNNLENFILPLMILALPDPEEAILESILGSLAVMASLGLFQNNTVISLIDLTGRFAMHPNAWVRQKAASFLASAVRFLSPADRKCTVTPLLNGFFRLIPNTFDELNILDALQTPLNRNVYSSAVSWAAGFEDSKYWKYIGDLSASSKGGTGLFSMSTRGLSATLFAKAPKSAEDQQWIQKLRDAGMSREDESKFLALSEYIWQVARKGPKEHTLTDAQPLDKQMSLSDLRVQVNTFQMDFQDDIWEDEKQQVTPEAVDLKFKPRPQTISDALLDASATIGPGQESHRASGEDVGKATSQTAKTHDTNSTSLVSPRYLERTLLSEESRAERTGMDEHRNSRTTGRSSAIDLIQRGSMSGKATPELGTSEANALGKVNTLPSKGLRSPAMLSASPAPETRRPREAKHLAVNGYGGRDPNVLRLLESLALANHAPRVLDLGPEVAPVTKRAAPKDGMNSIENSKMWSAARTTVAIFSEHTGKIRRLLVSPDHAFFITGSEDGAVKIWDTNRLERNVAHRSRQTYRHAPGVKVTALCFLKDSHVFASAGSDGSIHLVRVDCAEIGQGVIKYKQLKVIRQGAVPNAGTSYAVWMEHTKQATNNMLLIATNSGEIHALNLDSMTVQYTLENPPSHGTPTCFCIGQGHRHWLLIGTAMGVLDLWDLRFHVRLKSFAFPDATPITRIALHPRLPQEYHTGTGNAEASNRVYISGGTTAAEITAWDIEEMKCVATWRMMNKSHASRVTTPDARKYSLLNADQANMSRLLKAVGDIEASNSKNSQRSTRTDFLGRVFGSTASASRSNDSIQTFVAGLISTSPVPGDSNDRQTPYLYAAGSQNSLVLWNLRHVNDSFVVAGLPRQDGEEIEPNFVAAGTSNGIAFYEETSSYASTAGQNGADQGSKPRVRKSDSEASQAEQKDGKASPRTTVEKESHDRAQDASPDKRTTQPRLSQQTLLRKHLDLVTDVAVIERPYRMFVSVDRSGVIFVFA